MFALEEVCDFGGAGVEAVIDVLNSWVVAGVVVLHGSYVGK